MYCAISVYKIWCQQFIRHIMYQQKQHYAIELYMKCDMKRLTYQMKLYCTIKVCIKMWCQTIVKTWYNVYAEIIFCSKDVYKIWRQTIDKIWRDDSAEPNTCQHKHWLRSRSVVPTAHSIHTIGMLVGINNWQSDIPSKTKKQSSSHSKEIKTTTGWKITYIL